MVRRRAKFSVIGSFKKTREYLNKISDNVSLNKTLREYGQKGVEALSKATPVDTGETADSWSYEIIQQSKNRVALSWNNSNVQDGVNIAFLLDFGHAMPDGSYYQGQNYIMPALDPVMDKVADAATDIK